MTTSHGSPVDPEARTETMRAVGPETPHAHQAPPPAQAPPQAARRRPAEQEPVEEPATRNGMGTPALVLGLLAAATCWTGWAGVVLGLPAVVAGYLGARRAFHDLATDGAASLGGLVTGLVGLIAGAIIVWPTLFGSGGFGDGLTLDQCMAQSTSAREMHMCKSQHLAEFNERYPNAAE
ncbi:hypothetical protein PHK61_01260 [Actinomycetospora lutea]|uniref:hypothetical protein n=1 Tax=Actinomycetospora lutea TaxID=663604 RepID=UPI002366786E|nr:hypothetical protein [Actinomycetospora lutea]MDD7937040.1 hypothetical protein [Actinomycetospora lutea]